MKELSKFDTTDYLVGGAITLVAVTGIFFVIKQIRANNKRKAEILAVLNDTQGNSGASGYQNCSACEKFCAAQGNVKSNKEDVGPTAATVFYIGSSPDSYRD